MLRWQLTGAKQLQLAEIAPEPLTKQLNTKIKVENIFFSSGDYNRYANYNNCPDVIGRYAVGVVSEVADNTILNNMDRVVIDPQIPCGCCTACNSNNHSQCLNLTEMGVNINGVMSNFVNVPAQQLHKIPDLLSNDHAIFVPYIALALNILDSLELKKGQHVAVFASSKLGLILAQLISYYKASPILISDNPTIIDVAKTQLGVFYTLDSNNCDIAREIQIVTGGRMVEEVIFLLNSSFDIAQAVNVASVGATLCLTGDSVHVSSISTADIISRQLKVHSINNGVDNYPSAINLLATQQVDVSCLMGQRLQFDTLDEQLSQLDPNSISLAPAIIDVD